MPEFMGFIIDEVDIPDGYQRCKNCGNLVGRGVIPAAIHWNDCKGKGFMESMISAYENKKQKGEPFATDDIPKLKQDKP